MVFIYILKNIFLVFWINSTKYVMKYFKFRLKKKVLKMNPNQISQRTFSSELDFAEVSLIIKESNEIIADFSIRVNHPHLRNFIKNTFLL